MKRLVAATVMTFFCFACHAEPAKNLSCDSSRVAGAGHSQQSANACPVLRLAQQDNRCTCTTYAGTKCTGPCMSAGKPYGCMCK
jgi:hypothetical protein